MVICQLKKLVSRAYPIVFSSLRLKPSTRTICSLPPTKMILNSVEFKSLFTADLKELSSIFKRHDYEIRIVGGAVRDLLMGKSPHDIDFATTATPEEMKAMFVKEGIRMLNMKGERHGTVTVRINDNTNYEITTLRIDVLTDGRHAEVFFTTNWQLDAERRDLTINAMFLGLDGTLYDYFNGAEDLKNQRVVFVGNVDQRIREDYLRILRYFRFYGRIAKQPDSHDPIVMESISNNLEGLSKLSGERLMTELRKILTGKFAREIMVKMIDIGISPYIGLPANCNVEEFKTVFDRSSCMTPKAATLIVALLSNEKEVLAFHNRMKMSNYERDMCLFICKHRNVTNTDLNFLKTLLYGNSFKPSDVQEWICELLKYRGESNLLNDFVNWEKPKFPVSGLDLIEQGIPKGPKVAYFLNELKRVWSESDFKKGREELLESVTSIKEKKIKK